MDRKIIRHLNKYTQLPAKKQFYSFLALALGYFSPLLGVVLFIFFKLKNIDTLYRYLPLYGAALALIYYVIMYCLTMVF